MPDHRDSLPEVDEHFDDACRRPVRFLDICEDGHLRPPPESDEPLHPHPFEADFWPPRERGEW